MAEMIIKNLSATEQLTPKTFSAGTGIELIPGPKGDNGASAYEVALENGFKGTEKEWLASLQGAQGKDGATGPKGDKGDKGDIGATGEKGPKGDAGEPFAIAKTYSSYDTMIADAANVSEGAFVLIVSDVNTEDNGHLYVRDTSGFTFIVDMSGVQGIQGPKGEQGESGVYVGTEEPTDDEMLIWINPEGGASGELATKSYVDEAIKSVPGADLTGYATEKYVDDAIAAIDIPKTDLTNYYTKEEVDNKIPSLEGYALKTDIPDVTAFQTEEQVNALIAASIGEIENGTY